MGLTDKIRFHYNYRIRPRFNGDLKRLFGMADELHPFPAVKNEEHIQMALDWWSVTHQALDGKGFPTKFNVLYNYGLGPSYPETTGYTLSTLLALLRNRPLKFDEDRVASMTRSSFDWLASIQFENGAWTGGHAALHNYGKPSIFNTGQILLGMVDVYESLRDKKVSGKHFEGIDLDDLKGRCHRAAHFLKDQMQPDGVFSTKHAYTDSPLTYYSRSMYGALNTGIVLGDEELLAAIRPHYDWVTSMQEPNGWINQWGFEKDWAVMHRISYTLRGMLEAALHYQEERYFEVVLKGIDFLINTDKKGFRYGPEFIPSYYSRDGKFKDEICPTGLSQLAIVLAKLPDSHRQPKHERLFQNIVDQTKHFQTRGFKNPFMNGVLPGSYPLGGKYQSYDLLEWATKFFVDTLMIQMGVPASEIKG